MPSYYFLRDKNSLYEFEKPDNTFLNSFRKKAIEVKMFHVPHGGETILIRNKKKAILYEAGEGHENENYELAKKIRKFLKNNDVKLRAIVSSHNHGDHSNAIGPLVEEDNSIFRNDVEFFHQNESRDSSFYTLMMEKLNASGIPIKGINPWGISEIKNWNKKQSIKLFCGPMTGSSSKKYYRSILMMLPFENSKFLFTGDVDSSPTENQLRKNIKTKNIIKDIDFLQITHHGSYYGTNKKFLEHIKCGIFASSSNKENKHDLDPRTEKRIEQYIDRQGGNFDSEYYSIFNTDWAKNIVVRTDGLTRTWDGVTGKLFEVQTG